MFKTIRAAGVTAAALFLCANAAQASAQTATTAIPAAATVSPSVHAAAPAQISSATTNVTAVATNAATPAVAVVHATADTSLTPLPARDGDQIVTPQGITAIVGRARPDGAESDTARPASGLSLAALVEQHAAAESEDEQFQCLASAVYFESRGEPLEGQLAVAEVILNRVASGRFRSTVCDVVTQPSQFSFVRGGRIPEPNRASAAWSRAVAIARIAMDNLHDVTGDDSLFFHATYVRPSWGRPSARIARIGNHIFYR
ncbi:MAG: cell wall hydrolase [Allosphingosinicella sp.]|uniref:cell wall hydrolase n=1 Tax=Allosphingosinicella sp. TaxID=2823234 RepID=UPI003929751E